MVQLNQAFQQAMKSTWSQLNTCSLTRQIPVSVFSGPLGAGKTTLLNRVLSSHPNPRSVALVINEIGAVAVDPALVRQPAGENAKRRGDSGEDNEESLTISTLASGCICCTIKNDFIDSMLELLARLDRSPHKIKYIIVETTGVADPTPVMNSITDTELSESLYLDQVLAVVDCPTVLALDPHLDPHNSRPPLHPDQSKAATLKQMALAQIDACDTIYLTKLDLFPAPSPTIPSPSAPPLAAASNIIRFYRPSARIIPAPSPSAPETVPWDLIFDIDTLPSRTRTRTRTRTRAPPSPRPPARGHRCDPSCRARHLGEARTAKTDPSPAPAHAAVNSVSYAGTDPLALREFRRFLDSLSVDVLRAKGILAFHGYRERFVVQVSGGRFEVTQDEWPPGETPGCRMVVIGMGIDERAIIRRLEECVYRKEEGVAERESDSDEWV